MEKVLNTGELKKLSGGDSFWARDLYKSGKETHEVRPQFTITLICNDLPLLRRPDKATWNRIRVIPFESTFIDPSKNCPETFAEQLLKKCFPMDKNFSEKLPGMAQVFAWYLLNWRKKSSDLPFEPPKVTQATLRYRKRNDIFREFIEESITTSDSSKLSLTELYSEFKEWFKENRPGERARPKSDIKEYFSRIWGTPSRSLKWKGYKIRTMDEKEEFEDCIFMKDEDLFDYSDVKNSQK